MNQELYTYLQQLHNLVKTQQKKIRDLEKTTELLKHEVTALKAKPAVRVDRIEYKFDQLKVESLEGTLNIGLNPSDLQGIEDFAVDNQNINAPFSPQQQMQTVMDIEDYLYRYLETDLPQIVNDIQGKLKLTVDDSYTEFIKEDIKKQLPARIDSYLRQIQSTSRSPLNDEELKEKILQQFKLEMENGVHAFLSNLPDNVKGMKNP